LNSDASFGSPQPPGQTQWTTGCVSTWQRWLLSQEKVVAQSATHVKWQSATVSHSHVLHLPAAQVPVPSQEVPSGRAGVVQVPVLGSQTPARQGLSVEQARTPQVPSAGAPSAARQV
jgi:hypothetical protein